MARRSRARFHRAVNTGMQTASVLQQSDSDAPTVVSIATNVGGTSITIGFDDVVTGHSGFTLHTDTRDIGLTYSAGEGTSALTFTLDDPVIGQEVLTVDYTPGDVIDDASNPLAGFTGTSATNNASTFDPTSPSEFIFDSGVDPGVGDNITVPVDTQTAEIILATKGLSGCPIEPTGGAYYQMYYSSSIASNAVEDTNMFDLGPRLLQHGTFWNRNYATIHGWRGTGVNTGILQTQGIEDSPTTVVTTANTGGKIGTDGTFSGAFAFAGTVKRVLIYGTNLSSANRKKVWAALRHQNSLHAPRALIVCDGDSLTAGYNSAENVISNGWTGGDITYPWVYQLNQSHNDWHMLNHGISSQKLSQLKADAANAIDPYYRAAYGVNIVVLFAGTNDFFTDDATLLAVQTDTSDYIAARQSAGFKVVLIPMLDRSGFSSGQRTRKDSFNAAINTYGADAVVTLPASLSGNSPWVGNPTKWDVDQTHLLKPGYGDLAPAVGTAILTLL